MKKYPKYIVLPLAIFIYFNAMTFYGMYKNNWKLQDDFWLIYAIEIGIIVFLFYVLKKQHDRKKE